MKKITFLLGIFSVMTLTQACSKGDEAQPQYSNDISNPYGNGNYVPPGPDPNTAIGPNGATVYLPDYFTAYGPSTWHWALLNTNPDGVQYGSAVAIDMDGDGTYETPGVANFRNYGQYDEATRDWRNGYHNLYLKVWNWNVVSWGGEQHVYTDDVAGVYITR